MVIDFNAARYRSLKNLQALATQALQAAATKLDYLPSQANRDALDDAFADQRVIDMTLVDMMATCHVQGSA
jgi:hypothetical protein